MFYWHVRILSLLFSTASCIKIGKYEWYHQTAQFSQEGYNITKDYYVPKLLLSSDCSFPLKQFFAPNNIIFIPEDITGTCSNYVLVTEFEKYDAAGVVVFATSPSDGLKEMQAPAGESVQKTIPAVYITQQTYEGILQVLSQTDVKEITLNSVGDVDNSSREIEPQGSDPWAWLSCRKIEYWLFLLFVCLCAVLFVLLFVKLYKVLRRRYRSSLFVQRTRFRQIGRIPTIQYEESLVINEACAVCLEDFDEDDEVKRLSCRHGFHPSCIGPWLADHDKCPLCQDNALIHTRRRIVDTCCCCCLPNPEAAFFASLESGPSHAPVPVEIAEQEMVNV